MAPRSTPRTKRPRATPDAPAPPARPDAPAPPARRLEPLPVETFAPLEVLVRAWLAGFPARRCSICPRESGQESVVYPWSVCRVCDERAVTEHHAPAVDTGADHGDNPVFIDGIRCWRRYRFGGHVTMRDVPGAPTLEIFHAAMMVTVQVARHGL